MRVFKFGGASIKDAESINNVGAIIQRFGGEELCVVISASGKITNALEEVVKSYFNKSENLVEKWDFVKNYHLDIANNLFEKDHPIFELFNDQFVEVEWIFDEIPSTNYDFVYDQIVSVGELLSTRIVAAYLNQIGTKTEWLDARDLIATDSTYREALIDWERTSKNISTKVKKITDQGIIGLTQGFIGSTSDNQTTTLGREGSDYSAAILSYCMDAEAMYIWKDVAGVLTADPRLFENVQKIDKLSYQEAIEMTYYGASVIHPKTIKPIQNKSIPLHVRSFLKPEDSGTMISQYSDISYPPMIMVEKNQLIIKITTRDFSFVVESHLAHIFELLSKYHIKVNMMRNSAISFSLCVVNETNKTEPFCKEIQESFNISIQQDFEVYTIRHSTKQLIEHLKMDKLIGMEEISEKTHQMAIKSIPLMTSKT